MVHSVCPPSPILDQHPIFPPLPPGRLIYPPTALAYLEVDDTLSYLTKTHTHILIDDSSPLLDSTIDNDITTNLLLFLRQSTTIVNDFSPSHGVHLSFVNTFTPQGSNNLTEIKTSDELTQSLEELRYYGVAAGAGLPTTLRRILDQYLSELQETPLKRLNLLVLLHGKSLTMRIVDEIGRISLNLSQRLDAMGVTDTAQITTTLLVLNNDEISAGGEELVLTERLSEVVVAANGRTCVHVVDWDGELDAARVLGVVREGYNENEDRRVPVV